MATPHPCKQTLPAAIPDPSLGAPCPPATIPDPSLGAPCPPAAIPDPSLGAPCPPAAIPDPSLGAPCPPAAIPDPSLGAPCPPVSIPDPSLGAPCPPAAIPDPSLSAPCPPAAIPDPPLGSPYPLPPSPSTSVPSPSHPDCLPPSPDPAQYMKQLLQYVSAHRWVYNLQVIRFFEDRWWEHFPDEWREPLLQINYDELNKLPYGFVKDTWPRSLCEFILGGHSLCIDRAPPPSVGGRALDMGKQVQIGMTPKKLHEVGCLAGLVVDVCARNGCQLVLDIGSGLGYLGRCLSQQCGVSVIGVEREKCRVEAAGKRERDPSCVGHMTWESDSIGDILRNIPNDFSTPKHLTLEMNVDSSPTTCVKVTTLLDHVQVPVCMVGLHCCGGLTPAMMRLFTMLPSLRAMAVVSCCYHKMETGNVTPGSCFKDFPMSSMLQDLLRAQLDEDPNFEFNVFAMRLAAQETRARWWQQSSAEHEDHMRRVAFRGMLEAVYKGERPLPRKALRGLSYQSFEEYADIVSRNIGDPTLKEQLLDYHSVHSQYISYIEPFTALQVCMQGVLESLVLLDRCAYLRERGMKAELVPIFDEVTSPRNVAILAYR